jgi:hypothetical protein
VAAGTAVRAASPSIRYWWPIRAPAALGSSPVSKGPARRWGSFWRTGRVTDSHIIRPAVPPRMAGTTASTQGQAQPWPLRTVRTTVGTTVTGG